MKRRQDTIELSRASQPTSYRSCCARLTSHRVCAFLTLPRAQGLPLKQPSRWSARPATSRADLSAMVAKARQRLGNAANVSLAVEDGRTLFENVNRAAFWLSPYFDDPWIKSFCIDPKRAVEMGGYRSL